MFAENPLMALVRDYGADHPEDQDEAAEISSEDKEECQGYKDRVKYDSQYQ